jgi:protease secretion system outer membrane protein
VQKPFIATAMLLSAGAAVAAPATIGPPVPAELRRPAAAMSDTAGPDLVDLWNRGRQHDAGFRAAVAERRVNTAVADQSLAAYLPAASYSLANIPPAGGTQQVLTVTQPLVSLSGLATLRQRAPRRAYAEAIFDVREQDLATRTLTAVLDLIKANESTTFNEAKIKALSTQSTRAERLYRAGMGTVTDAREIEVRFKQALANRFLLASDQVAAAARLRAIAGIDPQGERFRLADQRGILVLDPEDAYLQRQREYNPQIIAARQTERINQLEAKRIRGSLFPVVGLSATVSRNNGVDAGFVGVSVTAPLNAGTYFLSSAARATEARSLEERRQVEEKAQVELERLVALVDGGTRALAINAEAITAAELSVEANSKSYDGGVRTSVDVVNAIQTLFEFRNAYVVAATGVAANLLNLLLLAGTPPEDALAQTQTFLFGG